MSKGLEALEYARIIDYTTDVALGKREPNKKLEESFDILEQELKEGEKNKKALEIIKENFVPYDIEMLKNGKVRIWVGHDKYFDVNKEQFDLLKKVLENE